MGDRSPIPFLRPESYRSAASHLSDNLRGLKPPTRDVTGGPRSITHGANRTSTPSRLLVSSWGSWVTFQDSPFTTIFSNTHTWKSSNPCNTTDSERFHPSRRQFRLLGAIQEEAIRRLGLPLLDHTLVCCGTSVVRQGGFLEVPPTTPWSLGSLSRFWRIAWPNLMGSQQIP